MLGKTLRRLIKHGRLTVVRADGDEEQFGKLTPAEPRPDVAVRLKGALTSLKLALHPDLYLGELYMDGALVLERGTLWDLLELVGRNQLEQGRVPGNSAIGPLRAVLTLQGRQQPHFSMVPRKTGRVTYFGGKTAIASISNNAPGRASCGTPIVVLAGGAAVFTYLSRTSR